MPLIAWLFAGVIAAFALQAVAAKIPRLRSSLTVSEYGVRIAKPATSVKSFSFEDVSQYQLVVTEHQSKVATKNVYVGSRADIHVTVAKHFSPIHFNLEFDRRKESGNLIKYLSKQMCDAIEMNLMRQLDETGELPLNENVTLTLDELQIVDPRFGTKRSIAIEEIGSFGTEFDSKLTLTKHGDGLPLIELHTNYPNFYPTLSLLCRLQKAYSDRQSNSLDFSEENANKEVHPAHAMSV